MFTNWVGQHGGIGVFPQWKDAGVRAMFSCRHDDAPDARDLDVGFHGRVTHSQAIENRTAIATFLKLKLEDFVFVRQVHEADVLIVGKNHRGCGATSPETNSLTADAIVTADVDVPLAILVADCVPILFYDPVRRVAAAAHSGWRGTVGHIAARVIESMTENFGSSTEHIRVSIGPSIRKCCYEVDDRVADMAVAEFSPQVVSPRFNRPGKFTFSLQDAIRMDLLSQGIRDGHIEDTGLCTSCRLSHFFSHRFENGKTGRQLAVISLV